MVPRRWLTVLRWILVLPAVGASFIAALFFSIPVNLCIGFLAVHLGFEPSCQFFLPWDGAMAAILFVLSGVYVAPDCKGAVAVVLFILGAVTAFCWLESMTGPSPHVFTDPGGLRVAWPMFGTLLGGASAVVLVFVKKRGSTAAHWF